MLRLVRLDSDPPDILPQLAGCLVRTPPERPSSLRYLVHDGDEQVAFIALDLQPDLFLYEIYVIRSRRNNRIGEWILDEVDHIAACLRYDRIYVRPEPLDDGDPERLKGWYRRHGYVAAEKYDRAMEKVIAS